MKKASQLINNNTPPALVTSNIIKFEHPATQQQDPLHIENAKLQTEIQALRLELAKAQRMIANYETLMKNALIREHEIRTGTSKRP
jgi:hypothetical protein